MRSKIAIEIISSLFVILFVYAALNKLFEYQKFTIQIGQSPLLTGFGDWLPWMVITSELLLAAMLLSERFRLFAFYGCFSLMVMFTSYIIAILNFTDDIPCSCGGVLEKLGWSEHLIFNSVFVLLAMVGIFLHRHENRHDGTRKRKALMMFGSLIGSTAVVAGLILFSGVLRNKSNSFLRLFPPHPVLESTRYKVPYNSYYLAGGTNDHIYLGNYSGPLHMLILNTTDTVSKEVNLNIEGIMEQKFWSIRIAVDSPYFYAFDGAVPRIYKGNISDWRAKRFSHDKEFFLDLLPIGSSSFFIKSLDRRTSESMLGKIGTDSPYYFFDHTLLEKQIDGFFCTDGTMLYNKHLNQLIYLYRYRNEFVLLDTGLNKLGRGHTIDTVSKAQIKVGTLAGGKTRKMAAPPLTVNKRGATYGNWLFVQSDLLAKNEHPNAHDKASVIDVYFLPDRTYRFSFYIYHYAGKEKLRQFRVYGTNLIALFDMHILLYKLSEKHFPDTPYKEITRVNQEQDRTPVKNSRSLFYN